MKHDLKIGQTIYLEPRGNEARRSKDPIEVKITNIGKKYFKVKQEGFDYKFDRERFFIEDLTHDGGNYVSNYQGYLSLREIEEKREAAILTPKLIKSIGELYYKELKALEEFLKNLKN